MSSASGQILRARLICRKLRRLTNQVCAKNLLHGYFSACFCAEELIICGGRSKTLSTPLSDVTLFSMRTLCGDTIWSPVVHDESFAWGAMHSVPFPADNSTSQANRQENHGSLPRIIFIGCRELSVASESQIVSPTGTATSHDMNSTAVSTPGARPPPPTLYATPTPSSQYTYSRSVLAFEWDQAQHTWCALAAADAPTPGASAPKASAPAGGEAAAAGAPVARELATSASIRKRVFLFGGLVRGIQCAALPPSAPWAKAAADGSTLLNDLWVLNVEKQRWKVYSCTGPPPSHRYGAAMESLPSLVS